MTHATVYALTTTVDPRVATALGETEATRARLVVAAQSQAEAVSALRVAGHGVFTSTFRRYGALTQDAREVQTATAAPGAVFAFSLNEPGVEPVRLDLR